MIEMENQFVKLTTLLLKITLWRSPMFLETKLLLHIVDMLVTEDIVGEIFSTAGSLLGELGGKKY